MKWHICYFVLSIGKNETADKNETTLKESEEEQLLSDLEHMKTALFVEKDEEERKQLTSTTPVTTEWPEEDSSHWWERYPSTSPPTARRK